ncbi:MAG: hypothetical protein EAZ71_08760 [Verrucomicrobia bacterium]|nr:MAG: hypothetical protein EAZ71_08760 [Verrucomicrobiota bacterium]
MRFISKMRSGAAFVVLLQSSVQGTPGRIDLGVFSNVRDYAYMNWRDGLRDPNFRIQTSRYVLNYHHLSFGPTALAPLANAPSEARALGFEAPPGPPVSLSCTVTGDGVTQSAAAASADLRTSQIVESGKFFNRRWQSGSVPGGVASQPASTGLETAAWPDRVSFVFHLTAAAAVRDGCLEMTLDLPDLYSRLSSKEGASALGNADGAGFVIRGSSGAATLDIDRERSRVTVKSEVGDWAAGQAVSVGIIVYPVAAGLDTALAQVVANESSPLEVIATGLVPDKGVLPVSYERDQGFHRIGIPKGSEGDNGQMRARIRVKNPSPFPRVLRLNFDGHPFYIPGISAVIRDTDGYPLGLPVQLSKNWHGPDPIPCGPAGFAGVWFHGLTMLTVPASSSFDFELMMVGENWGGMPAASHSQLSIIGYGGNQQWDQAALGNRAEALCYDMDHVLTDNDFTDSRPFLVLNPDKRRNWGVNAGGASILRYVDDKGVTRQHSRMRVRYERYGPVLANAIFAGRSDDGAMNFSYSAGIFRSEDHTRGLHRIRIAVERDISFRRLVFYQQAGDSYHYNQGDTFAYGNAEKPEPVRQWQASGNPGEIIGEPVELKGRSPWASVTNAPAEKGYRAANHGFIIRSWSSRIGGRKGVAPFLQERRVSATTSVLELVPPPGVTSLKAGDFVDARLVRVYIPRSADAYAGPDQAFREALRRYDNDPRMVLREAVGNHPSVRATLGELLGSQPIEIKAQGNRAGFIVRGGVGAMPVTFRGLGDYRAPVLEQRVGDGWQRVDQAVHGNDFWQCDFDAASQDWSITYTIRRDSPPQSIPALVSTPLAREFRFRVGQ